MRGPLRNHFFPALIGGCMVVAAGVWMSSGTLAPYATTLERPRIEKPCNYLLNTDHVHFEACFLMLDGAPRKRWEFTVYQRRVLYPLLAYPLMKAMGFVAGGVVTSAILQLAAFVTFALYVRRRAGDVAAYAAIVLVALYPGIYYWGGLPYNHVMIAPASLLGVLLIWEIERSGSVRRVALLALMLGVLYLGYDLLPLLAPPALLVLLLRRRFASAGVAAVMLVLPALLAAALITWKYDVSWRNNNSDVYFNIVQAYLSPTDLPRWAALAAQAPRALVQVYFFSNFWFLPALFAGVFIVNRFTTRMRMIGAEKWLLLTTLALFLFINLAPPTQGWQMRGSGLSRIYQPAFAAMILFIARWTQSAWAARSAARRWVGVAIAAAAVANAAVIFGGMLHITLADRVYLSFYNHASTPAYSKNLDTFGRRPLGFCDTSITIENPLTKRELKELRERNRLRKLNPPKKKKKKRPVATVPVPAPATAPSATAAGSVHLERPTPARLHAPATAAGYSARIGCSSNCSVCSLNTQQVIVAGCFFSIATITWL